MPAFAGAISKKVVIGVADDQDCSSRCPSHVIAASVWPKCVDETAQCGNSNADSVKAGALTHRINALSISLYPYRVRSAFEDSLQTPAYYGIPHSRVAIGSFRVLAHRC